MLFQDGKVNIPFPVKLMFQHRRIPNVPVTTGVNSRLPHFCCCRISPLRKGNVSFIISFWMYLLQLWYTVLDAFPLLKRGINHGSELYQWGGEFWCCSCPLFTAGFYAQSKLYFSYVTAQLRAGFLSLAFKCCGNSNGSTKSFYCGKWACFGY